MIHAGNHPHHDGVARDGRAAVLITPACENANLAFSLSANRLVENIRFVHPRTELTAVNIPIAIAEDETGRDPAVPPAAGQEDRLTSKSNRNSNHYIKRGSRVSLVLHAVLHMVQQNGPMTSKALAQCLGTNPVVVRRRMGLLRDAGS
ncbi:hypothetical protein RGQ15_20105 [Paracoccus sp. MBLB3053]|uniref:Transcriptional regulator n=1 Tax=Paracoccus aurantius TaxID=3073814 RepID=A0ABU2HZZ9_9RHOB|nr:hypothetical protein [Paracoccus sp. MBLB3053]MDS9469864.1 hypothetical protein [Paracoccus sp. MBLB3053]